MKMSAITQKTCSKCLETKQVSEFYSKARGYTSWCKLCLKAYSKQRVDDGRDKLSKIKYEEKNGHFRSNIPKEPKFKEPKTKKPKMSTKLFITKEIYRNIKKRCFFLNKDFDISFEQLDLLINDFCNKNYHVISTSKHPFKPSVDRIDSSKGYTMDNIKICWMIENYCKNSFTEESVIEFCKRKLGLM